ncbi:MAG: very short patch repair endonuclease [Burkholderiaceae bacterium]
MVDIMSRQDRSRLMSRVRQRDTNPEIELRKRLHGLGLRYRLHVNGLPGRPDLVFPKHRTVLFVHGCFWHGHSCRAGRAPSTNQAYWAEKLAENARRDRRNASALRALGWRVLTVWECKLKRPGDAEKSIERVAREIAQARPSEP